jgi:ATP-binding protein involved in chromosome partitioning
MRRFRTYHEVDAADRSHVPEQVGEQRARLEARLAAVGTVVIIASGKGGVGKSAITANLAAALARRGAATGALDADLNGPSLGRMLGVSGHRLIDAESGVQPAVGACGVRVMTAELLQGDAGAPLRWRGPPGDTSLWQGIAEFGMLREFLSDVAWDGLDFLLIDAPPGTDRIRRLLDLVPQPDLCLLVTTPAEIVRFVVGRSARLLGDAGVRNIALVANMMTESDPPGGGAVPALALETGLPLWASIPWDPRLARSTDRGIPFVLAEPESPSARCFSSLAERVMAAAGSRTAP